MSSGDSADTAEGVDRPVTSDVEWYDDRWPDGTFVGDLVGMLDGPTPDADEAASMLVYDTDEPNGMDDPERIGHAAVTPDDVPGLGSEGPPEATVFEVDVDVGEITDIRRDEELEEKWTRDLNWVREELAGEEPTAQSNANALNELLKEELGDTERDEVGGNDSSGEEHSTGEL